MSQNHDTSHHLTDALRWAYEADAARHAREARRARQRARLEIDLTPFKHARSGAIVHALSAAHAVRHFAQQEDR